MNIIYQPNGPAREYAALALNIYKGCEHGCRYCFGPGALKSKRETYYHNPNPKENIIERVRKDAALLEKAGSNDEILLSFIGDPYQPAEMEYRLTREVLKVLIEYNRPFTILTKGGYRATRDFDLLESYPKARFGTSLSFMSCKDATYWEPGAATVSDRITAIKFAHARSIPTWVSLEPVIYPEQAFEIIQTLHPYVDHWKVGKINHMKEVENGINWIKFREEVRELLESIGADYYLKKSLTELT